MLSRYSYSLQFFHRDGGTPEEIYFTSKDEALQALDMYSEPNSADIYKSIDVSEIDWETVTTKVIKCLEF